MTRLPVDSNKKVLTLARAVYDEFLRPFLPRKIGVYNGIAVKDRGLLDVTDETPGYESAIIDSLRRYVDRGDDVVVVGGGKGVTSVVAAQCTTPDGTVTVFEGGDEQVETVANTVRLNRMDHATTVRHAVVGRNVGVYGDADGAATVDPADLPECDVLELDCEGAETEILSSIAQEPRVVIVETHDYLGVPEAEVKDVLCERGYTILHRQVECAPNGVFVLTAERNQNDSGA